MFVICKMFSICHCRSENDCQSCTAGMFCSARGLALPDGVCEQGYYCIGGANNSQQEICPEGHYCPTQSPEKRPCPSGKYQNEKGKWDCKPCPAGNVK